MADRGLYVGLDEDLATGEGITPIAKIILDAKVFGLIKDDESCKNWAPGQIHNLYDSVIKAWDPFGSLPSLLPPELKQKHAALYGPAIERAKSSGWNPDQDLENER